MSSTAVQMTMRSIELPLLHCYRCGNSWTPRRVVVRMCPRCKSTLFDEPKLRVPPGGGGLGIREVLGPMREHIVRLAKKHEVREIRVFGSVARGSATPTSDVDFLVEFRGRPRRAELRRDLEELLHRPVDVVTEDALHWYVQPQVIAEAVPL